jgi:phosphatidate cytidylyltransferase
MPAPDRDPVNDAGPTASGSRSELAKRVASGVVMATFAVAAVALGGWPFGLFWAAAALGVFWEWSAIVADGAVAVRVGGAAVLIIVALAAGVGQFYTAFVALAAGVALVAGLCASRRRVWGAAGIVYAGTVVLAPVVLRSDRALGLAAILFLFAVVWATDILGFFIGRAVGGRKLAPAISPKKTWSGAAGGALGAVAAGVAVVYAADNVTLLPVACIALVLSIVSQAGDLFESAVKRRYGVKDASQVIPGHGGLMDRLDGFIAASGVAALVGLARGGPDAPALGLLSW